MFHVMILDEWRPYIGRLEMKTVTLDYYYYYIFNQDEKKNKRDSLSKNGPDIETISKKGP